MTGTFVEEDFQAWNAFPQHRWAFNKLTVALRLGYHAGPTGVPIQRKGRYIVRPTYNLYGMGIGARIVDLDPDVDRDDMIALKYVPPGYFWCEYLEGDHYSIDFKRVNDRWMPFCSTIGVHRSEDNLVQFDSWEKIHVPDEFDLPEFIHTEITEPMYLNVETKGSKIFEIHLRSGNDHFWDYPIGTIMYPVWDTDEPGRFSGLPFIENLHEDSFLYSAHGHLEHTRLGYRVMEPN